MTLWKRIKLWWVLVKAENAEVRADIKYHELWRMRVMNADALHPEEIVTLVAAEAFAEAQWREAQRAVSILRAQRMGVYL